MVFRILVLLLIAFNAYPAEIAGVKLPDEEQKLLLNGAGLRKRAFFQVYVIGLYLPEKKAAAADAIGSAGAKRIAIHMLRNVDADDFSEALKDGLRANHSEAEMKAIEPSVKQLATVINEMKEAKKGVRITLDWLPGKGTQVTFDGKPVGVVIAGEELYRGLLRIWLGDKPVQDDLKKALLGG